MIEAKNMTKYTEESREYYPQEMASALLRTTMDLSDEEFNALHGQLENALYDLMATAQNKYNHDYWRVLWNVLQNWAEQNVE